MAAPVIAISVIALVVVIWLFGRAIEEPNLTSEESSAPPVETQASNEREVSGRDTEAVSGDEPADIGDPDAHPQLKAKVNQWYRSHGYYIDLDTPTGILQPTHSYDALDNSALEALVASGDLIAASKLGDRLLGSLDQESVERGMAVHREAATLGSTYSLTRLGQQYLRREATGDPAKDWQNIQEGLAWMIFASERGDPAGNFGYRNYMALQSIDAAMISGVCNRARAIRSEIDDERRRRGYSALTDTPFPETPFVDPAFSPVDACS